MRIERIEKRARSRTVDVYVDGEVVLSIAPLVAAEANLRPGDQLTQERIARLQYDDDRRRGLDRALRWLARRPHSSAELRARLRRAGFGRVLIDDVLARIAELGYLDDRAFATYWRDARQSSAPRSRNMLRWELGGKGIPRELSDDALDGLDDDDAALAAASRRASALDPHDEEAFRRRLTGFLRRRGFSWEVTQRTIDHLWNATQAGRSA